MTDSKDITLSQGGDGFERIAGTVEVEAGTYWTAQVTLDAGRRWNSSSHGVTFSDLVQVEGEAPVGHHLIPVGQTHLIERIKTAEGHIHTIVLMGHPFEGTNTSYEILVREFLNWFSPEHDADAVRARELAALQGKVDRIQHELVNRQNDPALDRELLAAKGIDPAPLLQAGPLPMTGSALVTTAQGVTQAQLDAARKRAEVQGALAEAKAGWLTAQTGAITKTLTTMGEFYKERGAAALAKTHDVQKLVKHYQKGLTTLGLYTGEGVEVVVLREGEEASADASMTVFQRKLFVDEETLINHAMGGADCRDLKMFGEALRNDESLLNRLLPTERCVVLLGWRRHDKHYEGDPVFAAMLNQENRKAFLLLRNGDRVYQVYSDVSTANSTVLFPTKGEISDKPFQGSFDDRITVDSVRFSEALDAQAAAILHYRRLLILLWGLNDREGLLGAGFHDPAVDPKFLSLEFQEKRFRFVADAEDTLPSGWPPLREWIRDKNNHLQSGSRVLCLWKALITDTSAPGCFTFHDYRSKSWQSYEPKAASDTMIVAKDCKDLIVTPEVFGHSFSSHGERSFNARVTLDRSSYQEGDRFSFLVLDAVRPEEIDWYLNSRVARTAYLQYVALFTAVRDQLKVERAAEEPMRAALVADVAAGLQREGDGVQQAMETAIQSWRAAHRGRPLPASADEADFKKVRHLLLDQIFVLLGGGADPVAQAWEIAAAVGRKPLRLCLSGRKKFILYAEPRAEERRDDLLVDDPWTVRMIIEAGKSGWVVIREGRETLAVVSPAAEKVLHEWPEAKTWGKKIAPAVKLDVLARLAGDCAKEVGRARWEAIVAPLDAAEVTVVTERALRAHQAVSRDHVVRLDVYQPIGLFRHNLRRKRAQEDGVSFHVGFQQFDLFELIYLRAVPNARYIVEAAFERLYATPERAVSRLRDSITRSKREVSFTPLAEIAMRRGAIANLKSLLDPARRWDEPAEVRTFRTCSVEAFEQIGEEAAKWLTGRVHGETQINAVDWL